MSANPTLSVCVEMVFADRPLEERVAAAAAAGADAVEIWDWREKDVDALRAACDDAGVDLAGMTAGGGDLTDPDRREAAAAAIEESIETAARVDCPTLIVTVGPDQEGLDRGTQRDAIVAVLEDVAPAAEERDVTLVVEPLNTAVDHPGYFLTSSAEGFDIVERVDSPSVRLLYDVYHQQVTEGNVIDTVTGNVDLVGHVHVADVPGRNEPGTGELAYENVFAALREAGYDGAVGCEFRPTGDSEDAMEAVVERW